MTSACSAIGEIGVLISNPLQGRGAGRLGNYASQNATQPGTPPLTQADCQSAVDNSQLAVRDESHLVPQEGLEPPTFGLEVRRSIL